MGRRRRAQLPTHRASGPPLPHRTNGRTGEPFESHRRRHLNCPLTCRDAVGGRFACYTCETRTSPPTAWLPAPDPFCGLLRSRCPGSSSESCPIRVTSGGLVPRRVSHSKTRVLRGVRVDGCVDVVPDKPLVAEAGNSGSAILSSPARSFCIELADVVGTVTVREDHELGECGLEGHVGSGNGTGGEESRTRGVPTTSHAARPALSRDDDGDAPFRGRAQRVEEPRLGRSVSRTVGLENEPTQARAGERRLEVVPVDPGMEPHPRHGGADAAAAPDGAGARGRMRFGANSIDTPAIANGGRFGDPKP